MSRRSAALFAILISLSAGGITASFAESQSPAPAAATAAADAEKKSKSAVTPAEAADRAFSQTKSAKAQPASPAAGIPAAPAPKPRPAAPENPAKKRTQLSRDIERIIAGTPLADSRLGIEVISLDTGKAVYARNSEELLNPASNTKLFSTAAALSILGPGFRFSTEFFSDTDPHNPPAPAAGKKKPPKTNLYVRGGGDPTITTEKLWRIVNDLYDRGLRSVTGDIVLDESFFDQDYVGAGFDQETSDRAYMATPSSLMLNWNTIGVHIWPGTKAGTQAFVTVDPESDFVTLESQVSTRSRKAARRLTVSVAPSEDGKKAVVTAKGRLPAGSSEIHVWRKVDKPGLYFGYTLKRFLQMRGIQVKGKVRQAPVPAAGPVLLTIHQSDPLAVVMRYVNKNSSNIVAESLVKALGATIYGKPGSWKTGLYAIERYLDAEIGLKPGTYIMKNGSGLNDVNRFSVQQINRLLLAMWRRFPTAPEYLSSLGIAGMDGTLQYRMGGTEAVGRLRAKTGSLENVSALSGYVLTAGGEKQAFSIVANDFSVRAWQIVPLLDEIAAAIASQGNSSAKNAAVNLSPSLTPLNRLGKEIASLTNITSDHDPRILPALFARLSKERDPAMKALIAGAIFQNAPDNSDAVRVFMKYFDSGEDCLRRLAKAAKKESLHTPLILPLGQLASEGNAEAAAKLIELAAMPAAKNDGLEGMRKDLGDVLVEAAFNAPAVVFAALKNLKNEEDMVRAVNLLGAEIAKAEKEAKISAPEDEAVASAQKKPAKKSRDAAGPAVPHPFPALALERIHNPSSKSMRGASPAFIDALRAAFEKPAAGKQKETSAGIAGGKKSQPAAETVIGEKKEAPQQAPAPAVQPAAPKEKDAAPPAVPAVAETSSNKSKSPESGASGVKKNPPEKTMSPPAAPEKAPAEKSPSAAVKNKTPAAVEEHQAVPQKAGDTAGAKNGAAAEKMAEKKTAPAAGK